MISDLKQQRLLAINNYFYRRGGAEAIFLDHMKLFEEIGWEAIPFAMQHPENLPSEWSQYFVAEIEYGRERSALTKVKQAAKVIYSREAQRNISALIEVAKPDIAHAHNVYHHLSPSIFATLKSHNIPVVMTVHDLKLACPAYKMLVDGHVCEQCKGGKIYNVVANRCIKKSLPLSGLVFVETAIHRMLGLYSNKVDRFVVPSRFYREKLIEWGWPPEQLVYIPNFVETQHLKPVFEAQDYFLFAGRLAPEKGLVTLIHAAAKAGVRLVIAGTGPDEAELHALVKQLDADVTFVGHITGEKLYRLIGEARALVLPSEWYENAPVSILEAYALGTPVIGARIGGIPEMIREGETGLTAEAGNADDLAAQLSRMTALPLAERNRMGLAGREWILRDFSAESYRNRMLALYADLGVSA